uniref:Aspartic protease 6 n=1 Tax=Toxocara canis TaxID=6265 RepID=A0A183UXK9_TOXCA
LISYNDLEYVANITIGTPSIQQFIIVPDTGSANLWVADSSCQMNVFSDCAKKNLFQSSLSSTYKNDSTPWSIKYGDGSNAHGFLGIDSFTLGGKYENQLRIEGVTFGQATFVKGFAHDPADGVLGLAFSAISVHGVTPPVVAAIQQNLLDAPVFTVYMKSGGAHEGVPGGVVTYGSIDRNNCEPVIGYEPLSSASYWQFRMNGLSIANYSISKRWEAISDTGTSFIGGPRRIVDTLADIASANYDDSNDVYFIDCAAKPPPIEIIIGHNIYTITAHNYIIELAPKTCALAFFGADFGGFGPSWILGNPFIREYCQIHDIGNKRIGFAASKATI